MRLPEADGTTASPPSFGRLCLGCRRDGGDAVVPRWTIFAGSAYQSAFQALQCRRRDADKAAPLETTIGMSFFP
ncbi:MAG: hypothetical protein NZM28_04480 [Fimbriimonadales bacterium]|nr:hypothetical protein [Fimbriimonadales bacterium]